MPPVAGGMQRRARLGDVFPDDRAVPDFAIALAELVVRQANRPRIVGGLGMAERSAVQRDRARLIAAR
jgi:hypothetical protein